MTIKGILEPFKHKHNIMQHVLRHIIKDDILKNFVFLAQTDVATVHLTYQCEECKKDVHFVYDYDKGLIKFDDEALVGIEFTIDRIFFELKIMLDDQYHVMFNERNYDRWIELKNQIMENINMTVGIMDDSAVTNHVDFVEEFDVSSKLMTEARIENTCPLSLPFAKLKELYIKLVANYAKDFNITITNI